MVLFTGIIPEQCQLCHAPITTVFIDGRIRGAGQWAYMCPQCHEIEGVGLGLGKGQKFRKDTDVESPHFNCFKKVED